MSKRTINTSLAGVLLGIGLLMPFAALGRQSDQQTAPDNTKANKGDQNRGALTADQGKNNASDRDLAKKIRRDVVKDKTLSTYGHNVKIIAESGRVTLKGPVHTDDEKKTILQHAQKYAGDGNVVDQLTVKADK